MLFTFLYISQYVMNNIIIKLKNNNQAYKSQNAQMYFPSLKSKDIIFKENMVL